MSVHPVLLELLRCTSNADVKRCAGRLQMQGDDALVCSVCGHSYTVMEGVPAFIPDATTNYWNNNPKGSRTEDRAKNAWESERKMVRDWIQQCGAVGPSLEIGCGFGTMDDAFPGYIGLDYSFQAVTSEGHDEVDLVCGNAEQLPFDDRSMGVIFSQNTLEHIPKVDKAFLEMDRLLKPGGLVIIKPAWHCTRFQTELIPIRKYSELNLRQKLDKAFLPVLTSRPWKLLTKVPWRMFRRAFSSGPINLGFQPLTPNYNTWIADSDACASIDCHEGILFFESRGYECITHRKYLKKILAGHDWVVCKKPG